jgi:GNAT superfamily N-acetyltransferase
MGADPAISLRLLNNEALRTAQGWGDMRDLGGALAVTSDAPIEDLNCLESFTANDRNIESLLDIGFALLRAFDRLPAARVTPLDRPRSLAKRLATRGLTARPPSPAMAFRGDIDAIRVNTDVAITVAAPEDARTFAAVHAFGGGRWLKKLSLETTLSAVNDAANAFYVGYVDGEPAGSAHLLVDGTTAGIYAVVTVRAHRRRGVATTLIARAIRDAQAAGCDLIGLRAGSAEGARLFASMGFDVVHESVLWVTPG